MKKQIIILAIIITILSLNKNIQNQETIRFRIIANSNTQEDQALKRKIVNNLKEELTYSNATTIEEEREYIKRNLPTFKEKIEETLKEEQQERTYEINYGMNYFPEKEFQGTTYQEGEYESLVITLGDAKGKNFWCILFPPLCMVDEEEDIEYKSFIKEALSKFF